MFKYPRRWTKEQRFSLLSEYLRGDLSISELSRKHQVSAYFDLFFSLAGAEKITTY